MNPLEDLLTIFQEATYILLFFFESVGIPVVTSLQSGATPNLFAIFSYIVVGLALGWFAWIVTKYWYPTSTVILGVFYVVNQVGSNPNFISTMIMVLLCISLVLFVFQSKAADQFQIVFWSLQISALIAVWLGVFDATTKVAIILAGIFLGLLLITINWSNIILMAIVDTVNVIASSIAGFLAVLIGVSKLDEILFSDPGIDFGGSVISTFIMIFALFFFLGGAWYQLRIVWGGVILNISNYSAMT